jgi:serine/threonine-protein kinase
MSPEQAKGSKEMDHRSDLYSAGVILYEAVTGQVPFNAETFNELIFKIVLETPPPPEQLVPQLDPAFSALMQRSMAREAKDRFQSAQDFVDALQGWLGGSLGVVVPAQLPPPRPPAPSAPMLGQTPPPWANTAVPHQPRSALDALPPKKARAPALIGIAVGALLLGGGAVAGIKLLRGDRVEAQPAVLAASLPVAVVSPVPAAPVPALAPSPEVQPKGTAPAAIPEPSAASVPAGAAAKKPSVVEKRSTAPSVAKGSTGAPPAAPASTGRKIRTEL